MEKYSTIQEAVDAVQHDGSKDSAQYILKSLRGLGVTGHMFLTHVPSDGPKKPYYKIQFDGYWMHPSDWFIIHKSQARVIPDGIFQNIYVLVEDY